MRKTMIWILTFACIFTLAGCGTNSVEKPPGPEFPLVESVVQSALDELSLPWVIFDEETQSYSDEDLEKVLYTLRDPEKKLNEASETTIFYAGITSGTKRGNRELDVCMDARSLGLDRKPFAWEAWKQEITLATILYGGCRDREEACHALSKLDVPEVDNGFKLGVPLSNGYCTVKVRPRYGPDSESYILWIHFYETEALYREAQEAEAAAVQNP